MSRASAAGRAAAAADQVSERYLAAAKALTPRQQEAPVRWHGQGSGRSDTQETKPPPDMPATARRFSSVMIASAKAGSLTSQYLAGGQSHEHRVDAGERVGGVHPPKRPPTAFEPYQCSSARDHIASGAVEHAQPEQAGSLADTNQGTSGPTPGSTQPRDQVEPTARTYPGVCDSRDSLRTIRRSPAAGC